MPSRERIFTFVRGWRKKLHQSLVQKIAGLSQSSRLKLGLDLGIDLSSGREKVEVYALRLTEKTGPDGNIECRVILQLLQSREESGPGGGTFRFHGGSTLIVDEADLQVKYSITKNIASQSRLERMRKSLDESHSLRALYFGNTPFSGAAERFAMLHRME
jgi:hypothetical protein